MSEYLQPIQCDPIRVARPWGGSRIATLFPKTGGSREAFGEIWLLSDHPSRPSVIRNGVHAGRTLHEVLAHDEAMLLGSVPQRTVSGRFPLLLKLLDVADWLSIQVHPSDAVARHLGAPDGGKAEMWHVLARDTNAQILCGQTNPDARDADVDHRWPDSLHAFSPEVGDSFYVPPGTVHAIGPGLVLTEVQQTSDVTYRLYDWDREGDAGRRPLHKDEAAVAMGTLPNGAGRLESVRVDDTRELMCLASYFAVERLSFTGGWSRPTGGDSFHLLLNVGPEPFGVEAACGVVEVTPGEAALVPGGNASFSLRGSGAALDYYVPDVPALVRELGLSAEQVRALGGE